MPNQRGYLREVKAMTPTEIRSRAGKSRAWVAAMAGVSEPTAKLYEVGGPQAVGPRAREALDRVYRSLEPFSASARPTGEGT